MAKGIEIRKDFSGLPEFYLNDGKALSDLLQRAAREAGATVEAVMFKNLGENGSPPGCTCAVLLDESHITAHTYSEFGLLAVNVFTCGDKAKPEIAMQYIEREIAPMTVVFEDRTPRFN